MKKRYFALPAAFLMAAAAFIGDLKMRHERNESFESPTEAIDALQFITQAAAWPGVDIPPDGYQRAWQQYRDRFTDLSRSSITGSWQSIGPNNVGGRTLCVAVDPADTATVWLGSASGGLWKSSSGGMGINAWSYVNTGFPVLGVSSIAIDPSNDSVMYIGTGETYNYGTSTNGLADRTTRGTHGMGILKSTDKGNTWSYALNWSYQQQRGIWDIVINPLRPSTIFAATTEGIYRSYDAGANWSQVLNVTMCMDLVMHQSDTTVLMCGVGNLNSAAKGLYRSTNGGSSWSIVTNGLPQNIYTGRITIVLDDTNNDIGIAQVCDIFHTVGFYKTTNKGQTWASISNQDICGYQGWYAKGMLICSNNRVLAGGINLSRSSDGGQSFIQVSNLTTYLHSDIHDIVANPLDASKIYIATDGGLFRTNDYGDSYFECTDGYVTSQHYIGSVSSTNQNLGLSGLQDNYTQQYSGTPYWFPVLGGDGCYNAINPSDDTYQYASYQYLNTVLSDDAGTSFANQVLYTPASALGGNPAAFLAPLVIAPSAPTRMYAGGDSLVVSNDGGYTWAQAGPSPLDNGNFISTITVSATHEDSIYLATAPGNGGNPKVFRSVNGGSSFTDITGSLPNRYPRRMAVNPENSREVYIVYSGFGTGHVFKSVNGGGSWTDISGNLPDIPFHCILVDPVNSSVVYAGCDLGIFVSFDGGSTWNANNTGLPDMTMVFDIVYSPNDQKFLLFTHGHGVFSRNRSDLVSVQDAIQSGQLFTVFPNPASDIMYLRWSGNGEKQIHIRAYDLSGKLVINKTESVMAEGESLLSIQVSGLSEGTYILQVESGTKKSSRRFIVTQ